MPEKGKGGLQSLVSRLANQLGWRGYHTAFSQRSEPGFPDCVYLYGPRLVVAELKRMGEVPTIHQQAWLNAWKLVPCAETYLWYPIDYLNGTITDILHRERG